MRARAISPEGSKDRDLLKWYKNRPLPGPLRIQDIPQLSFVPVSRSAAAGHFRHMPPVTSAEKREATAYLSGSKKQQRISEPAVLTEVARRRIKRGEYGEVTPGQTRVKEASADLGLSSRQQKELRKRLNEPMPTPARLDSFFAKVDAPPLGSATPEATAEPPAAAPPVEELPTKAWRKRQLQRYSFPPPDADARWAANIELHVHRSFWAVRPTAFWQGHKLIPRPGTVDRETLEHCPCYFCTGKDRGWVAADVAADDIIAARRAAEEESELEDEGEERDEEMNGVEDETGAAEEMDTTSSPAEKDGMEGEEETKNDLAAARAAWQERLERERVWQERLERERLEHEEMEEWMEERVGEAAGPVRPLLEARETELNVRFVDMTVVPGDCFYDNAVAAMGVQEINTAAHLRELCAGYMEEHCGDPLPLLHFPRLDAGALEICRNTWPRAPETFSELVQRVRTTEWACPFIIETIFPRVTGGLNVTIYSNRGAEYDVIRPTPCIYMGHVTDAASRDSRGHYVLALAQEDGDDSADITAVINAAALELCSNAHAHAECSLEERLSCECETSGGLWITVHCRHFWMPTNLWW